MNGNGAIPSDFLGLYHYTTGVTEVPATFHAWSAMSLVAAALGDNCWYAKFGSGNPLYPNLYTILVGPSGLGKGMAIDHAGKFYEYLPRVKPWRGRITGGGLSDVLDMQEVEEGSRPSMYLITPELGMSIGDKKVANEFIKRVTEFYTGGDYKHQEATRKMLAENDRKTVGFKAPLFNWHAGSTKEWLLESIGPHDVESGFFARIFTIMAKYNLKHRVTDPIKHPHHDQAMAELIKWVTLIGKLEGAFTLTDRAARIRDHWYQNRLEPDDHRLLPSWKRQDDLVLKLATGLAATVVTGAILDGAKRPRQVIDGPEMKLAQRMVNDAHRNIPELLEFAGQTSLTSTLAVVRDLVKQAGRIAHSPLLKKASHHGIHAQDLKLHMQALLDRRDVVLSKSEGGGRIYEWRL